MKKLIWWVGLCGLALVVQAQEPVPPAATVAEVAAGTDRYKIVTPYGLANGGGQSNGVAAATATNIAAYQALIATNGLGAGDVTQSNLAAGIVPIRTTNDFAVTISSRGIANGQSSISNNGAMYGIDTPSTTTCGIQEAINAWDRGTNYGPTISTLSLEFGPGIFFYSNVITLSNLYTSAITWRGQSQLGTTWAYAGATTVTNTITVTGGDNTNGSSLDIPIHLTVRDGTFTALTNSTNVLLYIDHVSATYLENLNFTGWNVRTNQETGSGVSMYPTASLFAPGLVGLRINQEYDHNFTMDNIFFAGLAVGARVKSDHVVARNLKFAMISYGSYGSTNIWHTNSIYSIGAGIIQEGSSYDSSWHYGHCYAMRAGFAGVGQLHYSKLLNWHFESIQFPILSDSEYVPTLIEPAATSESMAFIDQYQLFTPTSANYPTNGYCPTTIPAIGAFAYGSGKWDSVTYALYVRLANNLIFVIDGASGALSADASGMTGIPAAALADGTTGSGTFARSSSPAFTTKITVGTPSVTSGSGAPSANEPIGSLYMRTDGSTSTSLYVKTASGAGAGNWTAK